MNRPALVSPSVEESPVALVVDDDAATRLMTRLVLEQAGFRVLEADDGVPALAILRSQQVDIVLLDVMMRPLDGFATCAALRALRRRRPQHRTPEFAGHADRRAE